MVARSPPTISLAGYGKMQNASAGIPAIMGKRSSGA